MKFKGAVLKINTEILLYPIVHKKKDGIVTSYRFLCFKLSIIKTDE